MSQSKRFCCAFTGRYLCIAFCLAGIVLVFLPGCVVMFEPLIPPHIYASLRLESASCYDITEKMVDIGVQHGMDRIADAGVIEDQDKIIIADIELDKMYHGWSNGSAELSLAIKNAGTGELIIDISQADLYATLGWGASKPGPLQSPARPGESYAVSWIIFWQSDFFPKITRWYRSPVRAYEDEAEMTHLTGDVRLRLHPGEQQECKLLFPVDLYSAASITIPYARADDDIRKYLVLTYTLDSTLPDKYMKESSALDR